MTPPSSGWLQGPLHRADCPKSWGSPSWRLLSMCCLDLRPSVPPRPLQLALFPQCGWPQHFEHPKLLCAQDGCVGGGAERTPIGEAPHVLPCLTACGSLSPSQPPPNFTPVWCACVSRELSSWCASQIPSGCCCFLCVFESLSGRKDQRDAHTPEGLRGRPSDTPLAVSCLFYSLTFKGIIPLPLEAPPRRWSGGREPLLN